MDQRSHTPWESCGFAYAARALKLAGRRLRRSPGFSIAVLCSLAICIGPNIATFSALHELLLKPLPFPNSSQLVTITNVAERSGGQVVTSSTTQYLDFREHADLFSGFATFRGDTAQVVDGDAQLRVRLAKVSANLLDVLQITPLAGRFFVPSEETTSANDEIRLVGRSSVGHGG